ncbi:hypothetical protein HWV62_28156 [Athelia sp. TMB]|nr:hypothetical protein HWV62_28156 [Athelia sp. TMB]
MTEGNPWRESDDARRVEISSLDDSGDSNESDDSDDSRDDVHPPSENTPVTPSSSPQHRRHHRANRTAVNVPTTNTDGVFQVTVNIPRELLEVGNISLGITSNQLSIIMNDSPLSNRDPRPERTPTRLDRQQQMLSPSSSHRSTRQHGHHSLTSSSATDRGVRHRALTPPPQRSQRPAPAAPATPTPSRHVPVGRGQPQRYAPVAPAIPIPPQHVTVEQAHPQLHVPAVTHGPSPALLALQRASQAPPTCWPIYPIHPNQPPNTQRTVNGWCTHYVVTTGPRLGIFLEYWSVVHSSE